MSNGGSISLINMSGPVTLTNVLIENSTSTQGYGGGLSFITDSNVHLFQIRNSYIEKNKASQGGGIYFELKSAVLLPSLLNTTVRYNTATTLGGGIFY